MDTQLRILKYAIKLNSDTELKSWYPVHKKSGAYLSDDLKSLSGAMCM